MSRVLQPYSSELRFLHRRSYWDSLQTPEKCNENKEDKTWVYRVMTRKPKKSGPLSRAGEAVRSNIKSTVVTYFLTARNVFIGNSFLQATRLISTITRWRSTVWSSKYAKNIEKMVETKQIDSQGQHAGARCFISEAIFRRLNTVQKN